MKFGKLDNGDLFKPWKEDMIMQKISPIISSKNQGDNCIQVYPKSEDPFTDWLHDNFDVLEIVPRIFDN